MATMQTVEVVVFLDALGDYGVGRDAEGAGLSYEDGVQPVADAEGFRLFRLKLSLPLPTVVELTGTVPEDGGEVQLTAG